MEAIFLQILNMSLTASYVILAVIFIRWLLRKSPKKYSYLLWSVVAFRLLSPVSFQSIFSLFSAKPFDMSVAQGAGGAALRYLPTNLGLMPKPTITLGIPYANDIINGSLPSPIPAASANPLQVWITVGAILWVLGIVTLLAYSLVTYLRLRKHMDNAILLAGNVYQSDLVRSPFILGFFQPRIYIPFGLSEESRCHVLAHENCHLKRGDHITKLLAFLLLAVHWFNPLCWLAFALMSRDMEMSCDEKVLSGGENIRKAYSASLLSFAANRRLPLPSPLAFGEIGVRRRIKNALNWQAPKTWVTVGATMLALLVLAACAANPPANTNPPTNAAIKPQVYVSQECVFMCPLSSYMPLLGESGLEYHVGEDSFKIVWKGSEQLIFEKSPLSWDWQELTTEQWSEWFSGWPGATDLISAKKNPLYLELSEDWILLDMEGDLWIMGMKRNPQMGRYVWDVYRIVPKDMP